MEFSSPGCKKLNDGILEAAEVHFASGRRTVVSGARVVSGAEKKAFDRGGPLWQPSSNAADDRLEGGRVWGGFAPPAKNRGSGGQRPPAKTDFFF